MTTAARCALLLCAVQLAGCDRLLGLDDIVPDGEATQLAFTLAPSAAVTQRPFDVIAVAVHDIQGKPVPSPGRVIRLTVEGPGGASLSGAVSTMVKSDTAYFGFVVIDRPGTYMLVASADGLAPATRSLVVAAPPFTRVATGVDGGSIGAVAVSAAPPAGTATLLAAASNGVYTSTNGGTSWKSPGPGGDIAHGFVVADPQHPGVAYAASSAVQSYLVKKTEDGGASWHALRIPDLRVTGERTQSIAVDPKNPSTIYVVANDFTETFLPEVQGWKLHRSSDGGASWSSVKLFGECEDLSIDPVTTSNLYCIARTEGVYRSTDAGANWMRVNNGIGSPIFATRLLVTPEALLVVSNQILYRSTDAGASWAPLSITSPGALAYAPSMPRRIYLKRSDGIAVSDNAGATFGTGVAVPGSPHQLVVDANNPDAVYAATIDGVLVSTSGGAIWSRSSKGIDGFELLSVALSPTVPGTLLISLSGTTLRTTNSGASWTAIPPLSGAHIAFDPAVPTTVYACDSGNFATSSNSGASFGPSTTVGTSCEDLAVAGATIYAGGGTLRKSIDRGATWAETGLETGVHVSDLALGNSTGSIVLVRSSNGLIVRSINGGSSFAPVSFDGEGYATAIIADPRNPSNVLASFSGCHVRLSSDGGASFPNRVRAPCINVLDAAGPRLYAAGVNLSTNIATVLTSSDVGMSWQPIAITGGIPDGATIRSLAASGDGTTIYLGTSTGLYRSTGL